MMNDIKLLKKNALMINQINLKRHQILIQKIEIKKLIYNLTNIKEIIKQLIRIHTNSIMQKNKKVLKIQIIKPILDIKFQKIQIIMYPFISTIFKTMIQILKNYKKIKKEFNKV